MEDRHPGGRPNLYPDTQAGFEKFKEVTERYMERRKGEGKRLNVSSWCLDLKVSRQTLYNYKKRSVEWERYIKKVVRDGQ